jgi:hypothetical protein
MAVPATPVPATPVPSPLRWPRLGLGGARTLLIKDGLGVAEDASSGSLCRLVCNANLSSMATETHDPGDDPRRLLSTARELAQRVRKDQRATWLPLLVFAALVFVSIPLRRYTGHHLDCRAVRGGRSCRVYSDADFVYWPIALVLAYVAIAVFYVRRSRARGIGTRVRPYAAVGIVVAVALTGAAFWELHHPRNDSLYSLASPGAAIGLALLVLAWAERSRALLVLTLGYAAVVLLTFAGIRHDPPWYSLPAVVQGGVLLLGGIGFALAQRPLRPFLP